MKEFGRVLVAQRDHLVVEHVFQLELRDQVRDAAFLCALTLLQAFLAVIDNLCFVADKDFFAKLVKVVCRCALYRGLHDSRGRS